MKNRTSLLALTAILTCTSAFAQNTSPTQDPIHQRNQSSAKSTSPAPVLLKIEGEDAKELYLRLSKKEFEGDGSARIHTKNGKSIQCTMQKTGVLNHEYHCSLSVKLPEGRLHEIFPVGEALQNESMKAAEYQGNILSIGGKGKDNSQAILTIRGRDAFELYSKLSAPETEGKLEGEGQITAMIKNGENLQCYRTIETLTPVVECVIKLTAATGEIASASQPAGN